MKPGLGHVERIFRLAANVSSVRYVDLLCRTAVYVIRMYGGEGGEEPGGASISRLGTQLGATFVL